MKEKKQSLFTLKHIKKIKNYNSKLVDIKIIESKKNTAKELVKIAQDYKKDGNKKGTINDIYWVVFDKDGYTKHKEAFDHAKKHGINIAFSSIAFETWILLHLKYTTKPFDKSEKIISYMKHDCNFEYEKNNKKVYDYIKGNTNFAKNNAIKLNKYSAEGDPNAKIYELNPYTNIFKLLKSMDKFWNELNR